MSGPTPNLSQETRARHKTTHTGHKDSQSTRKVTHYWRCLAPS